MQTTQQLIKLARQLTLADTKVSVNAFMLVRDLVDTYHQSAMACHALNAVMPILESGSPRIYKAATVIISDCTVAMLTTINNETKYTNKGTKGAKAVSRTAYERLMNLNPMAIWDYRKVSDLKATKLQASRELKNRLQAEADQATSNHKTAQTEADQLADKLALKSQLLAEATLLNSANVDAIQADYDAVKTEAKAAEAVAKKAASTSKTADQAVGKQAETVADKTADLYANSTEKVESWAQKFARLEKKETATIESLNTVQNALNTLRIEKGDHIEPTLTERVTRTGIATDQEINARAQVIADKLLIDKDNEISRLNDIISNQKTGLAEVAKTRITNSQLQADLLAKDQASKKQAAKIAQLESLLASIQAANNTSKAAIAKKTMKLIFEAK